MDVTKTKKIDESTLFILLLALLAGALNTAGFLQYGQTLSHMTGNLTKLGLALTGRTREPAVWFLLFLLCFMLGAMLSGLAFPNPVRSQWRRCGLVLLTGGALMLLPEMLNLPSLVCILSLALALGAQNGLVLRCSDALMRTTHVTGHLTDVGAALGRLVVSKGLNREDWRDFLIHLLCLVFFLLGALLAALYAGQSLVSFSPVALCGLCYALSGLFTLGVFQLRGSRV